MKVMKSPPSMRASHDERIGKRNSALLVGAYQAESDFSTRASAVFGRLGAPPDIVERDFALLDGAL
jgi:hypothetical protein